ncbi:MAG: hypothetical protein HC926_01430 [Synechococcaceae cyanobacterium SM2_3_60]|nr:hypothetical protein [Synechococcaceae cyanobacterium SM2_3_60]
MFDIAVKAQDALRLSLYYEALREHYEQQQTLPKLTLLTFGYLYANGLPDVLLDFLGLYAEHQGGVDQQKATRLIQAALAGSETIPEPYRDSVHVGLRSLINTFFHRYWAYPAASHITQALIQTLKTLQADVSSVENRLLTIKFLVEICDLSQDCGETDQVEHYLPLLQAALGLDHQLGATLDKLAAHLGMLPSALGNVLQRLVGMLNYQSDNLKLIHWLQTTVSPIYQIATGQITAASTTELKQRVRLGFLSQYWGVHPIGILTEPMLKRLNHYLFESYLYRDAKQKDGDYLTEYLAMLPNHYRNLVNASVESVSRTIQADQLDVLVGMDSIETAKGMAVLRCQAAPYQISWLGGDSPALPEIQGMVGDSYLISEAMQALYHEEPLLCGSYMAVQGFAATPLKVAAFREWLKIADDAVVLWTNAVGRKRSLASIRAQVEILAAVPKAVLIVKGWCYTAKVAALYRQIAEPVGSGRPAALY